MSDICIFRRIEKKYLICEQQRRELIGKHDQRMISHMIRAIKSRDHYMTQRASCP